LRGWRLARVTRPRELPRWRAVCFFAGLLSLWLALASPLDPLNQFLLVAHMTQHLLLMTVAPPLLLMGNPVVPMLRGLPRDFVREELAPWMNARAVHWLQRLYTSPVFGWITMDLAVVLWHLPPAYELALRSSFWHQMEHACFFFFSVAFWWYVIRPWPSKIRSSRWLTVPYLISSSVVLGFVGLVIALDQNVVYPTYAQVPRLFGIDALTDQALAGGEMIYVGLLVIIGSLVPILLQLLNDKPRGARDVVGRMAERPPAKVTAAPAFDLLHAPLAGAALRRRHGRLALQLMSMGVLAAVIFDGLHGVQVSPFNLAGAMLWNVARPLNLIVLLLVANVFCMACPFTLPREMVRRLGIPQLRWPEWLSSKWPAAVMMLVFFWAYEQFALWNSPRDTALLLIAYVVAASLINTAFRGASFCKYVCPVGQFNFLVSQFAPAEVGVRSQHVCSSCATHDCVRGNDTQRGCELKLYVPNKAGNLDCTMCMDCVKACPQDNVSITLQSPLRELGRDPVRSSLGKTSTRADVAALTLVVVFSSVANAAVMTSPVASVMEGFRQRHPWAAGQLLSLAAVCVISAGLLLLYMGAARLLQALSARESLRTVFCRFSMALLPLGVSIWLGHLAFHLATSWAAIPAVLQHVWGQILPVHAAAEHVATMAHMSMTAASSSMFSPLLGANGMNLFDLQVWLVNLGLFVSWYGGRKLVREMAGAGVRAMSMTAVWALGSTALYAAAIWIFAQPMYMRGMGM
ncbi:MAG TPA: cytochrome c oxidase assembly protein, partial [Terracidiphilus sp.]